MVVGSGIFVLAILLWRATLGPVFFGKEDPETGETDPAWLARGWVVSLAVCLVFAVVGYVVTHFGNG